MEAIVTAIVAALAKLSEPAIKDAYEGLKALIVRKVGRDSRAITAINDVEAKPESAGRQSVLQEELADTKVADDAEIVSAARALLELLELRAPSSRVEARGERSIAVGGNVTASTLRTGDKSPSRSGS